MTTDSFSKVIWEIQCIIDSKEPLPYSLVEKYEQERLKDQRSNLEHANRKTSFMTSLIMPVRLHRK